MRTKQITQKHIDTFTNFCNRCGEEVEEIGAIMEQYGDDYCCAKCAAEIEAEYRPYVDGFLAAKRGN